MPVWGWKTLYLYREYIPYSGHNALMLLEHSCIRQVVDCMRKNNQFYDMKSTDK